MNHTPSITGGTFVELDPPDWLETRLAPWRVELAQLWRAGGVVLTLASKRARVPVLLESGDRGVDVRILDAAIPTRAASTLGRALHERLAGERRLPDWMSAVAQLWAVFADADAPPPGTSSALVAAWRAWPERVADPSREIDPLPSLDATTLDRAARAALAHHEFARGEALAALSAWDALGEPDPDAGFIQLHLDALALASLGRRAEALARLESASAMATDAASWLACAWLHELLEDGEGAVAAHQQVVALETNAWNELRLVRARHGEGAKRLATPDMLASVPDPPSFANELLKVLEEGRHHDAALDVLRHVCAEAPTPMQHKLLPHAARLHLWRLEVDEARQCLARLPPDELDARRLQLEGTLNVLSGAPAQGLRLLQRSRERGGASLEGLLWEAHAHLELDDPERALACIDEHILAENTLAAYLLKALALSRVSPPEEFARSLRSPTFLDALVPDVLPSLCSQAQVDEAVRDPTKLGALVEGILRDMGGNRSATPTWCRRGPDGSRQLVPIEGRPSGRDAAVTNLVRIRAEQPEAVLAGFGAVAARYPRSPHPHTYAGELLIWLGRYDDALAEFAAADEKAPTRWSFVGRSAVYELTGRSEQADRWSRDGVERFGELASATTHVYRGERLRRHGDLDAALRDLEIAVRHKPRRVGARMNLALVHHARGEDDAWARQLLRLHADAPTLLWEAGARPGRPMDSDTLERALELMVGNRSSFLHTMTDEGGQFRVIPAPERVRNHARLTLGLARPALARAIRDLQLR